MGGVECCECLNTQERANDECIYPTEVTCTNSDDAM